MIFLETRFPEQISYGSSVQNEYRTEVTVTKNDNTHRKLVHPYPIFSSTAILDSRQHTEMISEVIDLYHKVGGMFGGFRVKNFLEYTTNNYLDAPTSSDQLLLEGGVLPDGGNVGEWQLLRWYGTEGDATSTRRRIRKPVSGTVLVSIDGVDLSPSAFSVDTTTGIITFGGVSQSIENISQAAQAVVTITGHGFTTGQTVYFSGVLGMTEINGLRASIVSTTTNTFTVEIDSTGFTAYSSGGTASTDPQAGEEVRAGCEFDIPCRFETDLGGITYSSFDALDVNVQLVEILNP